MPRNVIRLDVSARGRLDRGQVLVLLAVALVAMLAMVGLIIDGGNAYAQQRATQNGADAASEAGAVTLSQHLLAINGGGAGLDDSAVLASINASADANAIKRFDTGIAGNSTAYYTDFRGNMLTPAGAITTDVTQAKQVGSGGAIPPCSGATCVDRGVATGVRAAGTRDIGTFVSGIIGITQMKSTADATAVAGYARNPCLATEGCALLPVTFGANQNICDGSGNAVFSSTEWLTTEPAGPPYTAANEAILSLCKGGEGAFGFLDFGCGNTANQVLNPCNSITFPTWINGQPGAVSSVEDELDTYAGSVIGVYEPGLDQEVLIPFHDGICNEDRPDAENPVFGSPPFPGVCAANPSGGGSNRYYHIPFFIGFILDDAEVNGSSASCESPPGGPLPAGNGSGGCLKGWFARVVTGPGQVSGSGTAGPDSPLTIQLIK